MSRAPRGSNKDLKRVPISQPGKLHGAGTCENQGFF